MQRKSVFRVAAVTSGALLLPAVAMQFTDEIAWSPADFLIAGILLFSAGLVYEAIVRRAGNVLHRTAAGLAVFAALLLVWMNLAVGLIGSESNPVNLLYSGVLIVGIAGTALARMRPRGMARAMFAMAAAQMAAFVIGLAIWASAAPSPAQIQGALRANVLFVALFVLSAVMFRRAATGVLAEQ